MQFANTCALQKYLPSNEFQKYLVNTSLLMILLASIADPLKYLANTTGAQEIQFPFPSLKL